MPEQQIMTWENFVGDTIYLDTNILILAVEQGNPWNGLLQELFEAIDDRAIHPFTSELTLAEVLAKPISVKAEELVKTYETLLSPASLIRVVPVDRAILRVAAEIQSELSIKLIDAIHVATFRVQSCDFFLSMDERLGRKLGKAWLPLTNVSEDP